MKEILVLGFKLFLITLVAALLLGVANEVTKGPIQEQIDLANEAARTEVMPSADRFELVTDAQMEAIQAEYSVITEAFIAYSGEEVVGYVFKSKPVGFGGKVEVTTGISADGLISGVRVGSHQETPGLGAKATLAEFYEQYNGLSASGDITVSKVVPAENQILSITGSTITSEGVTLGVNASAKAVELLK